MRLLLLLPCLTAASSIQQPSSAFLWSTDSRFGGRGTYKVGTNDVEGIADAIRADKAPEVLVAYLINELPSDHVADFSENGDMENVKDALLSSESSMVFPSVYMPLDEASNKSTTFEMLAGLGGQMHLAGPREEVASWAVPLVDNIPEFRVDDENIFSNGVTDTILVPLESISDAGKAIRGVQRILQRRRDASVVSLLTSASASVYTPSASMGHGRRLLASFKVGTVAQAEHNEYVPTFDKYIYIGQSGISGIVLSLILVWVTVLAASCTMDIQCPSQMWIHPNLPLKGRVDFG